MVQVAVRIEGTDYVTNELKIQIKPPRSYDEEDVAQDFFSDEVGRVLAFDGTRSLDRANNVLRETASRFPALAVTRHALVALGKPALEAGKVLTIPARMDRMNCAADVGGKITVVKPMPADATRDMHAALLETPEKAAETLGHVDYKSYMDDLSTGLAEAGEKEAAAKAQDTLHATLSARNVTPRVLAEIAKRRANLSK